MEAILLQLTVTKDYYVLDLANKSYCKNKVIILECCFAAKIGESLLVNDNTLFSEDITTMATSQTW